MVGDVRLRMLATIQRSSLSKKDVSIRDDELTRGSRKSAPKRREGWKEVMIAEPPGWWPEIERWDGSRQSRRSRCSQSSIMEMMMVKRGGDSVDTLWSLIALHNRLRANEPVSLDRHSAATFRGLELRRRSSIEHEGESGCVCANFPWHQTSRLSQVRRR